MSPSSRATPSRTPLLSAEQREARTLSSARPPSARAPTRVEEAFPPLVLPLTDDFVPQSVCGKKWSVKGTTEDRSPVSERCGARGAGRGERGAGSGARGPHTYQGRIPGAPSRLVYTTFSGSFSSQSSLSSLFSLSYVWPRVFALPVYGVPVPVCACPRVAVPWRFPHPPRTMYRAGPSLHPALQRSPLALCHASVPETWGACSGRPPSQLCLPPSLPPDLELGFHLHSLLTLFLSLSISLSPPTPVLFSPSISLFATSTAFVLI